MVWCSPCDAVVLWSFRRSASRALESCCGPFIVAAVEFSVEHADEIQFYLRGPTGGHALSVRQRTDELIDVLAESEDSEQIIVRVAALDIGKAELACCVRVPGSGSKRLQEV